MTGSVHVYHTHLDSDAISPSNNSLGWPGNSQLYKIAERMLQVEGHVPEMVWCHKFEAKFTATIRRTLEIERGSCVLYVTTFGKLLPILSQSGDEFLSAWWQVVLCHYTLWTRNVHHRDVSPSNLRVHLLSGAWIGVLNDYDISSIQRDRPSGDERAGTVPFMAIDLLEEDTIEDKVPPLYQHDAESFIWVLVWVCLRYRDGNLLRVREGRLLDDWLKVDAVGCRKEKSDFVRKFRHGSAKHKHIQPSSSHLSNWKIAVTCLCTLYRAPQAQMQEDESILQTWLLENVKSVAPDILLRHPANLS